MIDANSQGRGVSIVDAVKSTERRAWKGGTTNREAL